MDVVEELKAIIQKLSIEQLYSLRYWMNTLDDDDWDRQMRADFEAGRLDHVLAEVDRNIAEGRTEPLPQTEEEWARKLAEFDKEDPDAGSGAAA